MENYPLSSLRLSNSTFTVIRHFFFFLSFSFFHPFSYNTVHFGHSLIMVSVCCDSYGWMHALHACTCSCTMSMLFISSIVFLECLPCCTNLAVSTCHGMDNFCLTINTKTKSHPHHTISYLLGLPSIIRHIDHLRSVLNHDILLTPQKHQFSHPILDFCPVDHILLHANSWIVSVSMCICVCVRLENDECLKGFPVR